MNKEALEERYPEGIPKDLEEGVSFFKELSTKRGVKSVRLMSNFGKDLEQSLRLKTNVYKGVIVQVSSSYNLSEYDRAWFHPELTKARSLYKGAYEGGLTDKIGEINSNIGSYSTYKVDELGGQKMSHFTIVDTASKLSSPTVDHWIASGSNLKSVYSDYKINKTDGKTLQKHSQSLRDELGGSKSILDTEYVSLYKGANSYHFYNHVIKCSGDALVLQSSLMGYSKVSRKGDIAADSMLGFMDINKLTPEHRNRVYNDCKWDSDSLVNTRVMRLGEFVKGEAFRMVKGFFSPNAVHLDAQTTLKLTPTKNNIPEGVSCDEYAKQDIIPLSLGEEEIETLFKHHWKDLISDKYMASGKFLLPRDIVQKSLI